ncbi:MAG TPA: GAF domain-containing protein [Polyangiaceae bacterium]|nr:GAF domain-containing protein [Polyangiaceae bacterium]
MNAFAAAVERGAEPAVDAPTERAPMTAEAEPTERAPALEPRRAPDAAREDDAELARRARVGHSPSARALVNMSDTVVALAETAVFPRGDAAPTLRAASSPASSADVMHTLKSRILASADAATPTRTKARTFRPESAARPPNEAVALLHRSSAGEATRVARVEAHHAAGGPGEEAHDRAIALLLSQVAPFFDFEVVLVSAVTGEKTVHRVHRGLPLDGSLDVVPRELSFCTHTVSGAEPLVVDDAASEPFFRSSALVRDLGARSYLGIPLFSGEVVLGSLCAISRSPQKIRPDDVALLSRFSRVAQALVTHDTSTLESLVVEPSPWPGPPSSPDGKHSTALLYSAAFAAELVAIERARDAERASRLVTMSRATWRGAVTRLPESVVAGLAVGAPDEVVLLVPAHHPAFGAVTLDLARALGSAARVGPL